MRFRFCLGTGLLALHFSVSAAKQPVSPVPPAGACSQSSAAGATTCEYANAPLLMVSIQPPSVPEAAAPGPVVDELPFVSLFERSPLMRLIAWYCGAMAPVALILLTGITIFEYGKRRKKGSNY